jgi:hypothetical protein
MPGYIITVDLDLWLVVTGVTLSPISEPLKVPTNNTVRDTIVSK